MRNYVIINGINSNTIQGLAINILPPITKPMMRSQIEEIDGRDGDLVTELGYSAYDKSMEIGLWGTYDIDAIIKYFTGDGTIVFSTEPDKYYYFKILNQIDYEKLLKFKKATVTFHCQPYKYPTSETPLEEQYEYVEGEGTALTLNDTANAIFNKFDLKGNTSQNGTPTPDSPVPIQVVSGDNSIVVCGKNLAPTDWASKFVSAVNYNNLARIETKDSRNCLMYSANAGYGDYPNKNLTLGMTFKENTQYTISFDLLKVTGKNRTVAIYYTDNTYQTINDVAETDTWYHITLTSTANKTIQYIQPYYTGGDTYIDLNTWQIEEGTTETTYEPYTGESYPINLGDIELCKIGTYQDYIYKEDGSWYLHKEIEKVVLNGSEYWHKVNTAFQTDATTTPNGNVYGASISAYSNYFTYHYYTSGITTSMKNGEFGWNSSLYLTMRNDNCADADAFKTWLGNNNVSIYYMLATPTTTEITDETLKAQLDDLWENAISYKGQTNITQTNNDLPFILDVSALKDGSEHLIIDNIGTAYSKPTIDIEGTGIVDIYLNDEQIFEIDMTNENEIIIDTEKMEAYTPDNTLANRLVTGDYSNFKLAPGENDLRFSGDLTKATVTRYIRWI